MTYECFSFDCIQSFAKKQVGGVHSHLISRVQRDKSRVGCFMSQNEIMMTVFPMFQQYIEPHLVHAHVSGLEALCLHTDMHIFCIFNVVFFIFFVIEE